MQYPYDCTWLYTHELLLRIYDAIFYAGELQRGVVVFKENREQRTELT